MWSANDHRKVQRSSTNNLQSRTSLKEGYAFKLVRLEGCWLLQTSSHRQDHQFGCVFYQLDKLNTAIHQKCPALANYKSTIFHYNAIPHTSLQVVEEGAWLGSFSTPSIFAQSSPFRYYPILVSSKFIEWTDF